LPSGHRQHVWHRGETRSLGEGPYADQGGTPVLNGGGTQLIATEGSRIGPGGQSVSGGYLAYYFYEGDPGGAFQFAIQKLGWDADG
jgi:arabinan endo-1,5-alpha-L-arabinosidase